MSCRELTQELPK